MKLDKIITILVASIMKWDLTLIVKSNPQILGLSNIFI